MGTISAVCAICGATYRRFNDDTRPDQTTHGICSRLDCTNEWRARLGLPPVNPTDRFSAVTAAYLGAVAEELSAALVCEYCGADFEPCCRCMPPFPSRERGLEEVK